MAGKKTRGHPVEWIDRDGNKHIIGEKAKVLIDNYLANGYNVALAYRQMMGNADIKPQTSTSRGNELFWASESQEYLKHERQRLFDEKNVDKLRILDRLTDIAFAEKGDKDYQTTHQLKALELLSKWAGVLEDKKGDGYGNIKITIDN